MALSLSLIDLQLARRNRVRRSLMSIAFSYARLQQALCTNRRILPDTLHGKLLI